LIQKVHWIPNIVIKKFFSSNIAKLQNNKGIKTEKR
jgi:hypothetical protein